MTMSRHDLGQQAIILLDKMRRPHRSEEDVFLNQQADRLLEAFHVKVKEKLNPEGAHRHG